ncbi:MAG: ABC transporter ATP-binding protein [Clostridia bacterium]|nr:ABC transporter ATP-binding protein [Clostridia bacterium]
MISVQQVSKHYRGRKALQDISFTIQKGEIFGLIGPNGAGKSTCISLLATINKPEAGDIQVDGQSILKYPEPLRGRLGYVPQEIALYPMLSAYENLDFWAGVYEVKSSERKHRIEQALRDLKLFDRMHDKVKTFSGGMKRRLNIAASLLHRPDILIMDEPTAGVDVLSRATIADLIRGLKQVGCTIIITSHYIDELELLCDRIAVLHNGSLLHTGTVDEVLKTTGASNLEQLMLKLEEE